MTVAEELLKFFNNPEDWSYAFCHEDYGIVSVARTRTATIDLVLKSSRTVTVHYLRPGYTLCYYTFFGRKWSDVLSINELFDEIKTL